HVTPLGQPNEVYCIPPADPFIGFRRTPRARVFVDGPPIRTRNRVEELHGFEQTLEPPGSLVRGDDDFDTRPTHGTPSGSLRPTRACCVRVEGGCCDGADRTRAEGASLPSFPSSRSNTSGAVDSRDRHRPVLRARAPEECARLHSCC